MITCTLTQYNEHTVPVTQLLRALKAVTISFIPLPTTTITSTTLITGPTDKPGSVTHLAS